jgi:hypothetical protein
MRRKFGGRCVLGFQSIGQVSVKRAAEFYEAAKRTYGGDIIFIR